MPEISDLTPTAQTNNPRWPEGTQLIPSLNDSARILESIISRWYRDTRGTLTATGGPTAYAVTLNQALTTLPNGLRISFKCPVNCGNSPQLNANGIGQRPLVMANGTALIDDDMLAGHIYDAVHLDGQWVMIGLLSRRRSEIRLQSTADVELAYEGFSSRNSGNLMRVKALGLNDNGDTVEYAEIKFGVRDNSAGSESGVLRASAFLGGVETDVFNFQGGRGALLGAALPGAANQLALPAGARILAGTDDYLLGAAPKNAVLVQSNSTYSKPSNLIAALVVCVGGGGGGDSSGTGGGSGGLAMSILSASSIPTNVSVQSGSGGAGNGSNGGTTSFLSLVANGGRGGGAPTAGAAGGGASGGQINLTGVGTPNVAGSEGGPSLFLGLGNGGAGREGGGSATAGRAGGVFILEF